MKTNMGVKPTTSKATGQNNRRTENKDNLDSRKNEEFEIKGDNVTHTKKEHQSANKKTED